MQSKKIDGEEINNIINNSNGDLGAVAAALMNQQKNNNQIEINKSLLPSRGIFYPNQIFVKKLTTVDIKNLSLVNPINFDATINGILAKNVFGIDVNDILSGDKMWFIFYLRKITFEDLPYEIKYNCESCGNAEVYNMYFKDLIITQLDEKFDYNYLMKNNDNIVVGFPRISDEIQENIMIKDPEAYGKSTFDADLLNIALFIKEINGKKVSILNAYNYIYSLDGMSFTAFSNYMGNIYFGVKPYIKIKCKCGSEIISPLVFNAEYFMPNIK